MYKKPPELWEAECRAGFGFDELWDVKDSIYEVVVDKLDPLTPEIERAHLVNKYIIIRIAK